MQNVATPIAKSVVLIGAGNAHLVFLKRWSMRPLAGVAVTLVNEVPVILYSAMVPGHIAGDYAWDEITLDLVRLCQLVKARFVPERVTGLDRLTRKVLFADRPPLTYDALSIGLGSVPACPTGPKDETSLIMRPLGALVHKVELLDKRLSQSNGPFHLVVVGGGASGCELALAIHKRLGRHSGFRLTLLQGGPQLLPQFPPGVARAFEQVFQERGVAFRVNARVVGHREGAVLLENEEIRCDAALWATDASPPEVVRTSGLPVDAAGFLRVRETLQSETDAAVFGTGDCVTFAAYPGLPRNGVHAVRQGKVLFDNAAAFLREQPLRPFQPQRFCLCLMNSADGDAILNYGSFTAKGRWARRLKDAIDRRWIAKFTSIAPMSSSAADEEEAPQMRCGGCGSKISSDVLSAVLKRIDLPDDPRILLGCHAGEDAAVHWARPDLFGSEPDKLVEVQTVDYFKAFVDDPYLFGRIAALNSVSDLYAMNARPFSALAIATLPYARGPIQEAQLYELLSGAVRSLREAGVVLVGGHTTEGAELALGFSVTGHAEAGQLFQKNALQVGDRLILTKPLGSGALLAAWMRGVCRAEWFAELVEFMLVSNRAAAEVFREAGVRACTDITGFGLAGHLLEMLDGSQMSARLSQSAVPCYAGFEKVVDRGIVSSLHRDNAKVTCRVQGPAPLPAWLFDPQTSGGLLAALPASAVASTLQQLQQAGSTRARVIGEVASLAADQAPGIRLEP
jgi:selenide,water dikinase